MNVYKSPFDNKAYSEYFFKIVNSHIKYFGITVKLYRSIVDESDKEYAFYQQTVDKRRYYNSPPETVSAIVVFPPDRPRLTNSKGIYVDTDKFMEAFFKYTDQIKLYDLIGFEYHVIDEKFELDKEIKYNTQEILLEVAELEDYGLKYTSQIMYKLVVARTQDIKELIKNHAFGSGGFGGDSKFGG